MNNEKTSWLQRPIHPSLPAITNEIVIFAGIVLLAIITRFYNLGARVMSHDESLHTYFSWLLYRGQGYQHTPMMHGPWQFHFIALSYFLFGVSDFTARIPAATFSIAMIAMTWYWRRYLGKTGGLIAGIMMVVSPMVLYYGRYVREDTYACFAGVLMLYAVLRYLETGSNRYLYLLSLALVIHFTDKETSFIYAAQALLFLGIYFLSRVLREPWENINYYRGFIAAIAVVVILGAAFMLIGKIGNAPGIISGTETAAPANPTGTLPTPTQSIQNANNPRNVTLALAGAVLIVGIILLFAGYGWNKFKEERSFDLMVLIGTFVLPMLIPFPIKWLEKYTHVSVPTTLPEVQSLFADIKGVWILLAFIVGGFAVSIAIGLLWRRDWWKYAALFWGIFTLLYTTIFTNIPGFFTGLVGSLGYWLVQQGVQRGSQPWYYYVVIQIPVYEFLPALGVLAAIVVGISKLMKQNQVEAEGEAPQSTSTEPKELNFKNTFALLTWWSIASIISLSFAGERMPWLTIHMAWPMILLSGWAFGQMIDATTARWESEKSGKVLLTIVLTIILVLAFFNAQRAWFGPTPPFSGKSLDQLQATTDFLFPLLAVLICGGSIAYLMKDDLISVGIVGLILILAWSFGSSILNLANALSTPGNATWINFTLTLITFIASIVCMILLLQMPRNTPLVNVFMLVVFGLLGVQTVRTSFRAAYINYDNATEYLVYAHGATGIKETMAQIEEISRRTAGNLDAIVAYDVSAPDTGVSWPLTWYLRDYTNQRPFDQPTRQLREAVAVIVDDKNFDKIEPALGSGYYRFDYIRMWWPNQDYFNVDRQGILNAITNPEIRAGIFDIWFNRDYTRYAAATGNQHMTLTTWDPSDRMRLYIRKDVAAQIWNYGVSPAETPANAEYPETSHVALAADQILNGDMYAGGLNAPRQIAFAPDGTFYVADSRNHRILHVASDGTLRQAWGSYAAVDISRGPVSAEEALKQAPLGTFNEPWGVAVGPDGSVYVSDTWNHRIQKFAADGRPIKTWGQYGQPTLDDPNSNSNFWGPRGLAVDSQGRVFVADTGNKRIVIFDSNGNYLTQFGSEGLDPGQFDEPVGVALAQDGTVFVTDTWNQRVQSFQPSQDGSSYFPLAQWDVLGWYGQSLDNKPFIAVNSQKHVFITDPESARVIEFTDAGQLVKFWGDYGNGPAEIGLASGVAVDAQNHIWVTDAGNNRILRYSLP